MLTIEGEGLNRSPPPEIPVLYTSVSLVYLKLSAVLAVDDFHQYTGYHPLASHPLPQAEMRAVPVEEPGTYTLPAVRSYLDEHGQVRVSDIRHDLEDDHLGSIGAALFELVEDGEIALVPVGDEVVVRSEK